MATRGAKLGLCSKTGIIHENPLTSVSTVFEIDWVVIISHDGTFSDNGRKPPFSVILWPLEGQRSPKSKSILNTHPLSVHTKFEMDCVNTFSDNSQKPTFSVILWPPEGQNLAIVA